jgi:hypothetical protein
VARAVLVTCLCVAAAAGPVYAQFDVGVHGGVHVDRAAQSDRVVTTGGAAMYAARGEASVLGARLGYWLRPTLGLHFDVTRSSNASWAGSTPDPPPDFANRTTYVSARAAVRTTPAASLQLFAAVGPALMLHGGTGTNLRTRDTDAGGVVEVGSRLRLSSRFGLQFAVSNYLYSSRYTGTDSRAADQSGSTFRHDLLLTAGVVSSWH